jgi:VWFA-related protein
MQAATIASALSATMTFAAVTLVLAQDQPQQPSTTIRLAVDRVPVDVSIVGEDGKPVTGLTADDFTIDVDGRSRRIVSAQYVSTIREGQAAAAAAAPLPAFSTNQLTGERLIMLVVDRGNIGPGRGRQAMEAAGRFVSKLAPADRVGLVAFPGSSPTIDFTSNHAVVQSALAGLSGLTDTFPASYRLGVSEAMAIVQGDRAMLNAVTQRECGGLTSAEERDLCIRQVVTDSNGIFSSVSERTQTALATLRAVLERLSRTPTPKTIVYISEGLVLERPVDGMALGPIAARGQVTIYALQLDVFGSDASTAREPVSPGRDKALAHDGLGVISGVTRGMVLPVAGNADNAFSRLALELSGYYLLSFEPESGDRDGRVHKIKVGVPRRSGLDIRARAQFSIDAPVSRTEDEILKETLQAPALANEIGLKLAAYTLRDPASGRLRILMAAEIDRAANPDGRLALAYSLADDKGRLIDSQIDRQVKAPVSPATSLQRYTGFILSDANGTHNLKVAVVDDTGRRGSVEHTFRAALTPLGDVRATDLLMADERTGTASAAPSVGGEFTSGTVNGYIELYSDAKDVLANTTVMFEVAADAQARALDGAAGKVQPATADSPNRRALEGSIPLALLPPGDYVLRAVVSTDGQKVGQVVRPLRVGKTVAATNARVKPTTLGTRLTSIRPTAVPIASRTEKFDRASVLTPEVVSFFVDRLDVSARGETNPAAVVEQAKAGRFDEAVKALTTEGPSLPSAFLAGLAHYSRGELEPAAAKFRESLRLDSEFFPAAFFLGSCYAAGGRDQDAVGAWQLALVTESDAPFIYTLLGDALLRLREVDHALDILNQAAAQWPDNDDVQVRIGAGLAMAGKRAEALVKLEAYLDRHPEDVERQFFILRLLYEARNDGRPIRSTNEDRALFAKWAAAYNAAKGPQQALVAQWQKAIAK